jgi:2-C-methyl-D-erythritol 4-phosphate cytidylyltransferase
MNKAVIIVAGGTGTRMGGGVPKQFLPLAGKPVMVHTIEAFLRFDPTLPVVVVMFPDALPQWESVCDTWFSPADRSRIWTCAGGAERSDSVHNGLLHLLVQAPHMAVVGLVAIHDAVRPFAPHAMLQRAFDVAKTQAAAVCCVSVKASLRIKTDTGSSAVDRSRYWEVQTPQVFQVAPLLHCYTHRPHNRFTDDAALFEHFGHSVAICEGSYDNIKLTTPEDMFVGEHILARMRAAL